MNTIINIFKKDFAKLKILLSTWCILLILLCINSSSLFLDNYKLQLNLPDINSLIAGLQYLLVIVIVPLLIQDDPLVGNSAFWLTRPISRKELLIEKILFLAIFLIILPLFTEMFVLVSNGASVQFLLSLIPEFIYLKLKLIIPVLVISSLTQKFSKYALVGIVVLVVLYLISLITGLFPLLYNVDVTDFFQNIKLAELDPINISLVWSIGLIKIIACAFFCIFIVHNQFINRDSKRTIKWIVFSFIIVAAINKFWIWDFLNIEKLQPKQIGNADLIKVEPDRHSVWTYDGYGFSNKNPEKKYKDVYLVQDIKGLPNDHFGMIAKIKNPQLTYSDGKVLSWDEDIEGASSTEVNRMKIFNPISSILKDTKILNKYEKQRSYSNLMKVSETQFEKYKESAASYLSDARIDVYKYRITSRLPLKVGAGEWIGNKQYVIYDIINTTFGVKIVIGEKKVDLSLVEGNEQSKYPYDDYGFSRGMDSKQPLYVLRNMKTGEAFVPEMTQNAQITKPKFNDSAILKSRICQFLYAHENDRDFGLPLIDKKWLKDAEIVRLEVEKVGYFNKKLAYEKILLDKKKDYVEKDGMRIYRFDTGEIKMEQPDINIKKQTEVRTYYKTGDVEAVWIYKDGELSGVSKTYYQNGSLKAEWRYDEGTLNGISKSFYESGELFYEYPYIDGRLQGITKKYNKTGQLIETKVFEDGELVEK